jgi:WD40 repeat protein
MDRGPGNQNRPDQQGLWVMQRDGSGLHRLLTPPPSAAGNFLAIGPLAWSADSKTLAYSVQPLGSGVSCPDPAAGGVWLTSVMQPQPRRLANAAQLGLLQPLPSGQPGCPLSISRLSWSPDGKRLAVSAYRLKSGATQPGDLEPVILAVNVGSGTARPLVVGGANGAFAPRSGRVAYTTLVYPTVTTIWVADPDGQHRRKVLTVQESIFDLVWAPDGRFLAFLDGPTGPSQGPSLRVAGLDGVGCTLLATEQLQQPPLLHGGSLSGLAWLSTGT